MTSLSLFRTVVVILGFALLVCIAAISVLAGFGKPTPGILENLAVGSLTGLAGLLSREQAEGAQPVTVVNAPADPVPVQTPGDLGHGQVDTVLLVAVALGVLLLLLGVLP